MLNCREAAHHMSKSMDTTLTFKERMSLALHVMMCPLCTKYKRQLKALRSMLSQEIDDLLHREGNNGEQLTEQERESLYQALGRSEA